MKETPQINHGVKSANIAKSFLLSIGIKEKYIKEICTAISSHCFPNIQKTKLAKILWDADKLSVFSKEIGNEYLKYWSEKLRDIRKARERLAEERRFYITYFHTKTAVTIANHPLNFHP